MDLPQTSSQQPTSTNRISRQPLPSRSRDFGIIPIPPKRRYHPEVPFQFTIVLNIIFGFASTTSESGAGKPLSRTQGL